MCLNRGRLIGVTFRVSLGLTVHAAESTMYSGLPRLVPAQVSDEDGFNDALFEADDPTDWRAALKCSDPNLPAESRTLSTASAWSLSNPRPEVFLPTVLLAQSIVNIHSL